MAENKFTYAFKYNLAEYLNNYFTEEGYELEAQPEYEAPTTYGDSLLDIAITHEKYEHLIVGIEIINKIG